MPARVFDIFATGSGQGHAKARKKNLLAAAVGQRRTTMCRRSPELLFPRQSTENGPVHGRVIPDEFGADRTGQGGGNLARSSMKAKSLTILRLRL